jgi:hypothetical protein
MRSLFLLLSLSLIFSGCKKEMPEPPTEASSNTSGWGNNSYNDYYVTFFSTYNGPQIHVELNGQTGIITYYFNYNPGCHDPGCANFTVPPGTYTYRAGSGSSYRYGTIVTGATQCITIMI